ncbi:MAG TPA: four helix bundle protein, partial [Anaerolineales bacterium]|nr:four helix bundle protein [Anaerolineales bacterium]
ILFYQEGNMSLITRFEEIQAWQEARKLVRMIYQLTSSGMFAKDFGLRDQIQRAAVSSMANIAEGFDCESKAELARFLGIARRSAVEVQSLLYAAFDCLYIDETQLKEYYEQARITKALIGGFKHSLKKQT